MSITEEMHEELMNHVFDSVKIAADYIEKENEINHIYICASYEAGLTGVDAFYEVEKKIINTDQIKGRTSDEQGDLSSDLLDKISDLIESFRKHKQDVPTQIRIIYSFENEKVNCDYKYEPYWSHNDDYLDNFFEKDFFNEWRQEIENQLNS